MTEKYSLLNHYETRGGICAACIAGGVGCTWAFHTPMNIHHYNEKPCVQGKYWSPKPKTKNRASFNMAENVVHTSQGPGLLFCFSTVDQRCFGGTKLFISAVVNV